MNKNEYEKFVELINKYESFTIRDLTKLYTKYGKGKVDSYFDRYSSSLSEEESMKFIEKFFIYFESLTRVNDNKFNRDTTDTVGMMLEKNGVELLTLEEEKNFGKILKEGREKLNIILKSKSSNSERKKFVIRNIDEIDDDEILYPDIDIYKIIYSISSNDTLNKLKELKHLPFVLHDDNILKKESSIIKKYLKLCSNGIVSESILKENFSDIDFDNIEKISDDELLFQLNLLKQYIIAKYYFSSKNIGLVNKFSRKIYDGKYSYEDRIQDGYIGLIKAINRFDVDKGYRFSTYAICWIQQNVRRTMDNTSDVIRKPVHVIDDLEKLRKFINDYVSINGCEPTIEECASGLKISKERAVELTTLAMGPLSLDITYNDEDEEISMFTFIPNGDPLIEDTVIKQDYYDRIIGIINSFSEMESYILFNRLGINEENRVYTLEEIGKKFNVTRERIRQREVKVLRKLRHRVYFMDNVCVRKN